MIRLGFVDDHPGMLEGVAAHLARTTPDIELRRVSPTVDGLFDTAAAAATAGAAAGAGVGPGAGAGRSTRAPTPRPSPVGDGPYDVVMLDLRLGDGSTPAANVERLRAAGAHVLVYCDGAFSRDAATALAAGALGIVPKSEPMTTLVEAIRQVAAGAPVVSPELAQALESVPAHRLALSNQEREVLRLYATDLPAKSVARRMGITEGTVKEYLKRIRAKLAAEGGVASTKLELRDVAEGMGLLDGQGRSSAR